MANVGHAQSCQFLAALVACCISASATAGGVLYVDATAPPRGDGTSWRVAFRFLQDALTAASDRRRRVTEIRVAQGTYLPDRDEITPNGSGDPEDSFALIDGVALRGGYAGLAGPDPDERDPDRMTSLLSGFILESKPPPDSDCFTPHEGHECDSATCTQIICRQYAPYCCSPLFSWDQLCAQLAGLYCQQPPLPSPPVGSDHIITAAGVGRSSVLDGFTISSEDTPPVGEPGDRFGRGVLLTDASPAVSHCRFIDNFIDPMGPHHASGGALAVFGGSPLIRNCVFESNQAYDYGGAIYARDSDLTIDQCHFQDNVTVIGAGSISAARSVLRISNSVFRFTFESVTWPTPYSGGAIIHVGGELVLENCLFESLTARGYGGAVVCAIDRGSITRCVFSQNEIAPLSGSSGSDDGGALWIGQDADLLVQDCRFFDNGGEQTRLGGAVSIEYGASVAFESCTFSGNATGSDSGSNGSGGAVFCEFSRAAFSDCAFSQNQADAGGAALLGESSSTFSRCMFVNNEAEWAGGAVYSHESTTTANECEFLGNAVSYAGGAISAYGEGALQLTSCRFIANSAEHPISAYGFGGAVSCDDNTVCRADGCLFIGNSASQQGGSVFLRNGCLGEFRQCTLALNAAGLQGGGICISNVGTPSFTPAPSHASVENSILWSNTDSSGTIEVSQLAVTGPGKDAFEVSHSCVQGWTGSLGGTGNIGDDPLFIDPLGRDGEPGGDDGDFRLSRRSPCIDSGDTSAVCGVILTDLDGEPRIADGDGDRVFVVDMGAYEAPGPALPASDLNCDGMIGDPDLAVLLSAWSIPPDSPGCGGAVPCAADLNHDGFVNSLDLGIMLSSWTT